MSLIPNMYKIVTVKANGGGSVGMKFQVQLPEVITYDFSMM